MAEASGTPGQASSGVEGWAGTAPEVAQSYAEMATQGAMGDSVLDYIGELFGEWTQELQALMQEHPFTGMALIITVGYAITMATFMRR